MALSPGTRLGHYDVTALLGEGGMGQVWQATDTQLNRQVALKILPDAFADDPDRLARFQREAQVLASLNHPNIAAIHGIEEAEGTRALVLELVEGPTLADRIAKGPIPLDEALPIAKQIAEALEAAHEAGVIHRDLKPANIKVREDGTVKVLDFGLAKALDPNPESDPSQSPTLTAAATQMGVILGTAAYMSPEQARGNQRSRLLGLYKGETDTADDQAQDFLEFLEEFWRRRRLGEGQPIIDIGRSTASETGPRLSPRPSSWETATTHRKYGLPSLCRLEDPNCPPTSVRIQHPSIDLLAYEWLRDAWPNWRGAAGRRTWASSPTDDLPRAQLRVAEGCMMVRADDVVTAGDSVTLSKSGRKGFIRAYEQRMAAQVTHPLFGYRVSYRRVLEIQARLLARFITGETTCYHGFETR